MIFMKRLGAMKRLGVALGRALALASVGMALAVGAAAGAVRTESLPSPTLGRDYRFTVYLPDGYADSCRRYPVVYLLHGSAGDEFDWLAKGKVEATLDRLIADKRIPPVIVVMPGHKGMWWVDGNAEKAETVLLKELLPEVEQRFRTIAERAGRAVAGLSAGGYGTIRLAFTHPELFAAGAALSPAIYEPMPPASSAAMTDPAFQKDGAFDPAMWQRLHWRALFDHYKAQPLTVPLYVNSGDRDRFDIAYHAAVFARDLRGHQPGGVVFRVVGGDHEWPVWAGTVGDALEYTLGFVSPPREPAPGDAACP